MRDLVGDTSNAGFQLPGEPSGNGFGNDSKLISTSSLHVEQYKSIADDIAERTVNDNARFNALHACVPNRNAGNLDDCAKNVVERLLTRAFRQPAAPAILQLYGDLERDLRQNANFKTSIQSLISAILQSPEFLYRIEYGTPAGDRIRPTGYEMATRLSYFFWASMPDDALFEAAKTGELDTKEGVMTQAKRLLASDKAKVNIRFFFDNFLPINALNQLERDPAVFPAWSAEIGSLMREETQQFLQHLIFDGEGDWASALTADYSFMNETLAAYYGINDVSGGEFRKVSLAATQRKGLLTQGSIMVGTTHTGFTNPVTRGGYIMNEMLCEHIPLPTGDVADQAFPPNPDTAPTARGRYTQHAEDPACRGCHSKMDPVGFVFENFDPIGLFRTHENDVLIDVSGELPDDDLGTPVANAIEFADAVAADDRVHQCFALHWANFAYGKSISKKESCLKETIQDEFIASGYDIQQLLLNLTQTDAFLYLPDDQRQNKF